MDHNLPKELASKYPRTSRMRFPDNSIENIKVKRAVFVPDHNEEREYWKGFEEIEWKDGDKELRVCYWTRKRGTESWRWGQFSPIISLDKLKQLLRMIEQP